MGIELQPVQNTELLPLAFQRQRPYRDMLAPWNE